MSSSVGNKWLRPEGRGYSSSVDGNTRGGVRLSEECVSRLSALLEQNTLECKFITRGAARAEGVQRGDTGALRY
eukprot:9497332-Pyramimonas_sp.AAC.2